MPIRLSGGCMCRDILPPLSYKKTRTPHRTVNCSRVMESDGNCVMTSAAAVAAAAPHVSTTLRHFQRDDRPLYNISTLFVPWCSLLPLPLLCVIVSTFAYEFCCSAKRKYTVAKLGVFVRCLRVASRTIP